MGHCQEVRDAAQLLQKVAAIVSSAATRRRGEGGRDLRELSMSATARPGNSLKRQLQLFEVVSKGLGGSGAKRVAATSHEAAGPALRPLRQVRQSGRKKQKAFREQLDTDVAPDAAREATENVRQNSLMLAHSLPALGGLPGPLVSMMLDND